MRRTLTFIPLIIVLALLATAAPVAARSKISIGVTDTNAVSHDPAVVMAAVNAHTKAVGTQPRLWSVWSRWGDRGQHSSPSYPYVDCKVGVGTCAFPTAVVKALLARKITPVIWWLPMDPSDIFSTYHGRYKKILTKKHDAYIRQWAVAARKVGRQTGKRVIVRFAHEATGFWFPWSVHRGTNSYDNYKKAWNYIGKKFQGLNARKHVLFMWANVWPMKKAFPGEKFVDLVGVTVLNFGSDRRWKTPRELLQNRAKSSRAITRKPIVIAEMGTHYKGGSKGDWINTAYKYAYNKNPSIRGIMYLETDQPHIARNQPDWRLAIGDGGAGMKAYRAIARQKKFKGRIR